MSINHRHGCDQPAPTRTPSKAIPGYVIEACPTCRETGIEARPLTPDPYAIAAELIEATPRTAGAHADRMDDPE